jgi:hypothetical protein
MNDHSGASSSQGDKGDYLILFGHRGVGVCLEFGDWDI